MLKVLIKSTPTESLTRLHIIEFFEQIGDLMEKYS
jgi:hypothetical protein